MSAWEANSGFAACAFTHWAILAAPKALFLLKPQTSLPPTGDTVKERGEKGVKVHTGNTQDKGKFLS